MRRQTARLEATLAQAAGRVVRGYGSTARPDPSGRMAAHRTDALHVVTGTDTADADAERADTHAGHRRSTPGHWTADAWTSSVRTRDGHTGHRTPDAWTRPSTRTGHLGTAGTRTDSLDHHRPPDCPLGRRTLDLWTARAAPSNDAGSATVTCLPARDYLPHHQAPTRSVNPAAPWRTALLDDYGSSVERTAKLHPLWQLHNRVVSGVLA
jgi:hypothetical protein